MLFNPLIACTGILFFIILVMIIYRIILLMPLATSRGGSFAAAVVVTLLCLIGLYDSFIPSNQTVSSRDEHHEIIFVLIPFAVLAVLVIGFFVFKCCMAFLNKLTEMENRPDERLTRTSDPKPSIRVTNDHLLNTENNKIKGEKK